MLPDIFLTEREIALRDEVKAFVRERVPHQLLRDMDEDKVEYPREYVENLGAANLLGLRFPPKWGGRDMKWTAEIAALEEIGVLGTALGCAFSMPSIVGEALNVFCNDTQKEKYLKPILSGKMISAEALTEPRGGSDFFGATSTAVRKGDYFILNGQKRFVVGARGADIFVVYCNTNPEGSPYERISMLLVERDMGIRIDHIYGLMGTRGGGTGRIVFKDVKVPLENLVGELNSGALIFNQMMIPERLTSAGGAIGSARAALEIATRYSDRRHAFGRVIRKFQSVSNMIAECITILDAARGITYAAAKTVDSGLPHRRMVSQAKKFSTDACWEITNMCLRVMGGIGYTTVYPIERMVRDARLIQIWTGTNEVMNQIIQHEYYQEILNAVPGRDLEKDAADVEGESEKCYTDEDMWRDFN
ncbi:MAG: acyl-CoA dehydrogenase family protein [Thermodesulfobacteriota bacterium]|nr:acyl-CoA dehydrogenase family protein [Thermodesulfobacteriota bacterium]